MLMQRVLINKLKLLIVLTKTLKYLSLYIYQQRILSPVWPISYLEHTLFFVFCFSKETTAWHLQLQNLTSAVDY